jgi:MFS family permease
MAVFSAGAGVGAFVGIFVSGVLVDSYGWRGAFAIWVPLGIVGTALMATRREPVRGAQDAAFVTELEESPEGEAALEAEEEAYERAAETGEVAFDVHTASRWEVARHILGLRTWRTAAIAIGVSQIMTSAIAAWGPAYFKRTFGLDGTQVGLLAPLIGFGSFAGLLGGGFLADRLLRRGVLRARVWVSIVGYGGGGIFMIFALLTTSLLVAAPLLWVSTTFAALPAGPSMALLMDATPTDLRSPAAAIGDIVMLVSATGTVLVGAISTLLGSNLRLALLFVTPTYLVGALLFLLARKTYVTDLADVVADAVARTED